MISTTELDALIEDVTTSLSKQNNNSVVDIGEFVNKAFLGSLLSLRVDLLEEQLTEVTNYLQCCHVAFKGCPPDDLWVNKIDHLNSVKQDLTETLNKYKENILLSGDIHNV